MRVDQLKARNFLSFGEKTVTVDFSDFNVIVGPNASGKTNALRAIDYIGTSLNRLGRGSDLEYYHVGKTDFEVEASLTLDEAEIEAFLNYLICATLYESVATEKGEDQPTNQRIAFEIASGKAT